MLYGESKSAESCGHFKFHTKRDATAGHFTGEMTGTLPDALPAARAEHPSVVLLHGATPESERAAGGSRCYEAGHGSAADAQRGPVQMRRGRLLRPARCVATRRTSSAGAISGAVAEEDTRSQAGRRDPACALESSRRA